MPRISREPKRLEKKSAPPLTPEARENMLISLAMDRAEEQLRDGTASAQVISGVYVPHNGKQYKVVEAYITREPGESKQTIEVTPID